MNSPYKNRHFFRTACIGVICALLGAAPAFAQHGGGRAGGGGNIGGAHSGGVHQHLDNRFAHNQYYFDHGYSVRRPPAGSVGEFRGRDGGRYRFGGGNWYRWGGSAWIVWGAPFGLFVPFLPPYFTTVWGYGIPYYYANDTYYSWNDSQQQYQVVAPPDGISSAGTTQPPPGDQLFAYPKTGQSSAQQAKDRQECERWAVSQTGVDLNATARDALTPQKRSDSLRAQMSCLEARGYSVD